MFCPTQKLPHPWYVIEDSHVNVTGLLEYFDRFLQPGDYLMVEDIHPLTQLRSGLGLVKGIGKFWAVLVSPFFQFA